MRYAATVVVLSVAVTLQLPRSAVVIHAAAQKSGDPFLAKDVLKPGPGVTDPVVILEAKPKYTKDATRAHIQGIAEVEVVVQADGRVRDARIHKSLDSKFGLDKEAVKAAKEWRFKPAMMAGRPVKVVMVIPIEFRLPSSSVDVDFERDAVDGDTPGLVKPRVISEEKPKYTSEAMRQKIQGGGGSSPGA
jgi:TonB family protein